MYGLLMLCAMCCLRQTHPAIRGDMSDRLEPQYRELGDKLMEFIRLAICGQTYPSGQIPIEVPHTPPSLSFSQLHALLLL